MRILGRVALKSWPDTSGCSLMAEFNCSDFIFRVCSLYAPNPDPERDEFTV